MTLESLSRQGCGWSARRPSFGLRATASRLFWALWLAVALLPLVHAQPAARGGAEPTRGGADTARQGFAWQARKGDRQLLLLATMHAATPQVKSLPPDIDDWVRQAGAVAVEADVSRADELQALVQRHGLFASGEPDLWARLPPVLAQRAQAQVRRAGSPPETVATFKPWLLTVSLATAELQRAGFNPEAGSEGRLLALAQRLQRPVVELEGTAAQIETFDSSPATVQAAYLEQMLDSIADGSANRDIAALTQAWVRRDAAAMTAIVERTQRESSKSEAHRFIAHDLLLKRHPALLDAIERHSAQHPTLLVAVGAMHWFGPGNLIDGLRQRGWDVTIR